MPESEIPPPPPLAGVSRGRLYVQDPQGVHLRAGRGWGGQPPCRRPASGRPGAAAAGRAAPGGAARRGPRGRCGWAGTRQGRGGRGHVVAQRASGEGFGSRGFGRKGRLGASWHTQLPCPLCSDISRARICVTRQQTPILPREPTEQKDFGVSAKSRWYHTQGRKDRDSKGVAVMSQRTMNGYSRLGQQRNPVHCDCFQFIHILCFFFPTTEASFSINPFCVQFIFIFYNCPDAPLTTLRLPLCRCAFNCIWLKVLIAQILMRNVEARIS